MHRVLTELLQQQVCDVGRADKHRGRVLLAADERLISSQRRWPKARAGRQMEKEKESRRSEGKQAVKSAEGSRRKEGGERRKGKEERKSCGLWTGAMAPFSTGVTRVHPSPMSTTTPSSSPCRCSATTDESTTRTAGTPIF